jgi:endonuclease/exonuclease/phosphatase family metal-dependent hydrolase
MAKVSEWQAAIANLPAIILGLALGLGTDLRADQTGDIIQLAFWNIRDFSSSSRDATELRQIATVIRTNDVVAICELNDTTVLGQLCAELNTFGGDWRSVQTSRKVGNSTGTKEYYGYVYRRDKVWPRTSVKILRERKFTVPGETTKTRFDREPAYCKFATLDGHLDFTVMVVHVTWGTLESHRKAEVRMLAGYFQTVQDGDASDDDVILCGDFNQNVNEAGSLAELLTMPNLVDTTTAGTPTVVQGSSTYDHILFET